MFAMTTQVHRRLSSGFRLTVWLAAFFSPTGYFLLLIIADWFHVPAPPETVVMSLFVLIPVVALIFCGSVVWRSSKTVVHRTAWLFCAVVAMLLQCGIILAIIVQVV
jgi:hypothetical protein